jgi:hypothetical protein
MYMDDMIVCRVNNSHLFVIETANIISVCLKKRRRLCSITFSRFGHFVSVHDDIGQTLHIDICIL